MRRLIWLSLFVLLFTSLAAAYWSAPTITVSSSTSNPPPGCDPQASQPGYTCTPNLNVSWSPATVDCLGQGCHIEYCLTQQGTTNANGLLTACNQDALWAHRDATFTLGNGNMTNYVYTSLAPPQNLEEYQLFSLIDSGILP